MDHSPTRDAAIREELAHYSPVMRAVEIMALLTFTLLFGVVMWMLVQAAPGRVWMLVAGAVLSLLVMDFMSGLVHWFADTWGTSKWFILGPTLIRSFREHHVDRFAITRHDFIETNGATALVALPPLIGALLLRGSLQHDALFFAASLLGFISLWALFTNQFHKWAHMGRPPAVILALQKRGIVLSIPHHAEHHRGEFDQSYCITTGWLNPLLNRVQFFRRLEALITGLTGAEPRTEDKVLISAVKG